MTSCCPCVPTGVNAVNVVDPRYETLVANVEPISTVAPGWKPVPTSVMNVLPLLGPLCGFTDVSVGAGDVAVV